MNEKTFPLEVAGIGNFVFRRRVLRDEFRIGAEYSRLTEGVDAPSQWLDLFATAYATLKVLAVEAPDGWELDTMAPDDSDTYRKIMEVFGALRAAEARFRAGHGTGGQAGGAGDGRDARPMVSPPLQPAAE